MCKRVKDAEGVGSERNQFIFPKLICLLAPSNYVFNDRLMFMLLILKAPHNQNGLFSDDEKVNK